MQVINPVESAKYQSIKFTLLQLEHGNHHLQSSLRIARNNLLKNILPVSQHAMEMDNDLLLFQGEPAALDIRPQVVRPPQSAALATP